VEAVESWVADTDVSERLRQRVRGERVLFHHRLRIAIAGCPNACSRPQIADIGVVGTVRPEADEATCTACGACARVCPDQAIVVDDAPPVFDRAACQGCLRCSEACPQSCIAVSAPRARILAGGKLGRHPHLAMPVGMVSTPAELVAFLDETVEAFLAHSHLGERFAKYWHRVHPGATMNGSVCSAATEGGSL
jgi:dissimilatory sulfite reductase (desulfoviridin) alpha/beta subunit